MQTLPLTPMRVLTAALCVAAAVVIAPLWAPLVLAVWAADLLQPMVAWLEHVLRGRRRAAAAAVVLLAIAVLVPLAGVVIALASEVRDLLDQVRGALEGQGTLGSVLLGGAGAHPEGADWATLAGRYGANAWRALTAFARASATVAIGVLVFVAALYVFAVEGERARAWLEARAPIPRDAFARLVDAFHETGRGLIVAGGGTALLQGLVSTIAYVLIGIPRALLLGPLTAVCALVPVLGTALVWAPLAIELALGGEYWRAVAVGLVGGFVSVIDNVVRPVLARHGRLKLPAFVVLVSMLGGIALFGALGVLLGPLLVRLCVESLAIASEEWRGATEGGQDGGSPRGPANAA